MKSSKNKKAMLVGLFTIIGIGIFMIGIFTLGGQHSVFARSISLKAFFADVNGLETGDNVWYGGVKVGTVKSVTLSEKSKVEVLMKIDMKSCRYIHNEAKAIIGSDGLMGNKIIRIVSGTDQSAIIKDGDTIGVDKALTIDELATALQQNNLNLLDITGNLKTVSKKIVSGEGTMGRLLNDESLMNNLESAISTFKQATINSKQLTGNLESYSAKLETNGSFANDLVTDTVIFYKLRETVSHIQDISKTIAVVADNLQIASKSLNDSTKPAGALFHDQEAADNMKTTLINLKSGTKKLDEDLEALQHNILFRGFFRKKAKQEAKNK